MKIRYLTSEDINPPSGNRHISGSVFLNHLSGTEEKYVLVQWHKKEGDEITAPEVIATIETATLTAEIEAFESGVVEKLWFNVGDSIPDGAIIATIGTVKRA